MKRSGSKKRPLPIMFESFGVKVKIDGSTQRIVNRAFRTAQRALVGKIAPYVGENVDHTFEFRLTPKRGINLYHNHKYVTSSPYGVGLLNYFDSILRVTIGEWARGFVFLHAGVVGWKGKALILPGHSHSGKSTAVLSLVKAGAAYLSDEFAIVDEFGNVHSFERPINIRSETGTGKKVSEIEPASLGNVFLGSMPVGAILFTQFVSGVDWSPRNLTPGTALMKLIEQALSIRKESEFTLRTLRLSVQESVLLEGDRPDSDEWALNFLKFLDNCNY